MRYGLENNRHWIKSRELFPVQSSVLDEEVLLTEVVKDYPIREPISCRFLTRGDSDIYRVKTATRNFYLKIYRPPKSLELAEAEALFVWALYESDIPVVIPVRRTDGKFACQVPAPEGIRPMLLYEEAPPPIPAELDEKILSEIGAKIGLLHNVADEFDTPFGIPEINIGRYLQERVFYISQFLSDQENTYLRSVSANLKEFLQSQPRNCLEFGLCHADLVMSNIRLTKEGVITLFDFGNAMKTWRAYELAVVYWSLEKRYKNSREKLWKTFLGGYKFNRPLPETLSENLNVMLVLRQIGFLGGNCATLPLRLGTEPFETGFIEKEIKRLRQLVEVSGILS
jgi:Ser/Thr protein kinase RdoA (MazF antagonist)